MRHIGVFALAVIFSTGSLFAQGELKPIAQCTQKEVGGVVVTKDGVAWYCTGTAWVRQMMQGALKMQTNRRDQKPTK